MTKNLKNKVVFITGSSVGIGRETAYKFSGEGCKIAITYYADRDEALKAARICKYLGASDVMTVKLDLLENASIRNAVGEIIAKFGEISVLINNAGVVVWKSLWEQSLENIEQQTRINLEGMIKITKEALPYITDSVVNVSSGAGMVGYQNLTTYSASKFGVRGFSQALADEMTELSVYCVNPGTTATRMTNYRGQAPQEVAQVIVNSVKGEYKLKSGSDVNVWELVSQAVG